MWNDDTIFLGASRAPDDSVTGREELLLGKANRHGLVTGATGTGKTVSLQIMAEGFSKAGVPVFCADIKGDVAGLAMAGEPKDFLAKRASAIGFDDYAFEAFPTIMWDVFGEKGHPVRATVTEMGPLLLSRLMSLTDAQEGVLNIAFRIADEEGLLLLDMKDLQSMLANVAERAQEISARYGNVTRASVGAIQRALLVLEDQGGDRFFGEPALDVTELMRTSRDGRGAINILAADRLMSSPRLYSTFLLWLLSELFEKLPEIGDPTKPRLVFFFDEAHLLFSDAPRALMERVEQVVRLIRSKGVGVYFVTQNPLDVPETVLAQLGNRVQHALRAYSPREQRAVKTAADTFRPNPDFDSFEAITNLGTGEALVSTLQEDGSPSMVQRTLMRPPSSRIGTLSDSERASVITQSPVAGRYEQTIDRESAYEMLKKQTEDAARSREAAQAKPPAPAEKPSSGGGWGLPDFGQGTGGRSTGRASNRQSVAEAAIKSVVRSVGSGVGRAIVRGLLGSLRR
ncbi:MAG: DUF853 domain-containing protein [Mesorhizobium sp.]|nr:DUF853 domain-containing protein [Mesorhizobium sp.]